MTTRIEADRGQAAVEVALALPVVVLLALGLIQVVVVAGDHLAVELAAREAARAAAVSADPAGAARRAAESASGLRPLRVRTTAGSRNVTVVVTYTDRTDVALIGAAIPDVEVSATVTMRREPP